jgi:hypothetical protein
VRESTCMIQQGQTERPLLGHDDVHCPHDVGALLVYDVTVSVSFALLGHWLEDLRNCACAHAAR